MCDRYFCADRSGLSDRLTDRHHERCPASPYSPTVFVGCETAEGLEPENHQQHGAAHALTGAGNMPFRNRSSSRKSLNIYVVYVVMRITPNTPNNTRWIMPDIGDVRCP